MKCIVCSNEMTEQLPWLFHCDFCGFGASSLTAGSGRGIEGLETLRRKNFHRLCDRLEGRWALTGKSVLEVGCAEGWFLEEAVRRGLIAKAIEPSSPHAEDTRSRGFDVVTGNFPDDLRLDQRFDFVVFNDVFEHLPDPVRAIKHCEELLLPNGVLILNLPSNHGAIYRAANLLARFGREGTLERLWQKGFPSPHLSYFNPSTLKRFVTQNTHLDHVETFALNTIVADGLSDRIAASHPGPMGKALSSVLTLAIPIQRILPSDIIVGLFQKSS